MKMLKSIIAALAAAFVAAPVFAQYPTYYPAEAQSPAYYPGTVRAAPLYANEFAQLVQPIALYPDPLLSQVLTASTYWNEIPEAAAWADEHSNLTGDSLANAIYAENVPWDPSVVALLPFPSVLDMMAQDPGWTQALGNAVLANRDAVMDAVQQMRQTALAYGYLRNSAQYRVVAAGPGDLEILPAQPSYVYVPVYNPVVIFGGHRSGVSVGISYRAPVFVGGSFARWGWGSSGFAWRAQRAYTNRDAYVQRYRQPVVRVAPPREERRQAAPEYRGQPGGRSETGRYAGGYTRGGRDEGGRPEGGHGERGH